CGLACTLALPRSPLSPGSHHAVVKPGTCPVVLRGSLGPCLELCDTDSDCPGAAKCCTTGCGHPQKPGRCPRDFTRCLRLEPPLCANDSSCPSWYKCCLRECRLRCTIPAQGTAPHGGVQPEAVEGSGRGRRHCPQHHWCSLTSAHATTAEKPGACPAAAPEGLFYPCSFPCLEDRDCLGRQKCCSLGCGSACLEPVQGKAQGSGTASVHCCVSAGPAVL
uniref:Uncharacterized protein n=1 Tax=Melopsittacus undulatus TaxID=13146 RepID=A0A8V5H7G4_MELUD